MPDSEVNGVRVAYDDVGSGPVIVAVHGWGGCRQVWKPQIDTFALTHRFIAIDLPGHGDSGRPPGAHFYSPKAVAEDVRALMDNLGIARAVLMGQSMGTFVGQLLYHGDPQRVRALVLTGALSGSPPKGQIAGMWVDALAKDIEANGIKSYLDRNMQYFFSPGFDPAIIKASTADCYKLDKDAAIAYARSVSGYSIRERLHEIKAPTLIVNGTHDGRTPPEESEFMNRQIPDCSLRLIKGAGHLANVEQPAIFNRAVLDFLKSLD